MADLNCAWRIREEHAIALFSQMTKVGGYQKYDNTFNVAAYGEPVAELTANGFDFWYYNYPK